MDELKSYEVIKKLVETNGNKDRAAMTLNVTRRHINRLIIAYRSMGKAAFMHGNRGRKPATAIPDSIREDIVTLYKTKYYGANFTHFTEMLSERERITVSTGTVTSILEEHNILSPRITRLKKKRIAEALRLKQRLAKTRREKDEIQKNLVAVEDAHARRSRCRYFGEMEQMDASPYEWIRGQVWHLHVSVDDATGFITGAWFDTQETLRGYYHVLRQILINHGIPYKFFTDKRSVFTYKKRNSKSLAEDSFTQFGYACKQLGIELDCSSVPQAKGRVERLNQSLQSRLPVELRLAGITTIEAANEFLTDYVKKYNQRFGLPSNGIKSVFEKQPPEDKINLILAVLDERTVDDGHCIRFEKQYYRMLDALGMPIHYRQGTKVMVIKSFDGKLFCNVNDKDIYALEVVAKHAAKSKDLDADYKVEKPKKPYIPPMNHPWRRSMFNKFVRSQEHHWRDDILTA